MQMPVLLERASIPGQPGPVSLTSLESLLTVWALRRRPPLSFHPLGSRCLKPFLPMVDSDGLKKCFLSIFSGNARETESDLEVHKLRGKPKSP